MEPIATVNENDQFVSRFQLVIKIGSLKYPRRVNERGNNFKV